MITAEILGGLGNQMFILFTLIAYSLENKVVFYLEDKDITIGDRKVTYWDNIFSPLAKFIKPVTDCIVVREKDYSKIKNFDQNIKLCGYFQSYKYFESQKDNIIKLMRFKDTIKPYTNLYDYKNTISMHFRLGDYKNLPKYHPILDISYYEKALSLFIERTNQENWQVLYFFEEEDSEYIEEQIAILSSKLPTLHFLKINVQLQDWEQMIIMSLCQHNIIANSTFSLWASYLNLNDKLVFCPSTIFGPAFEQDVILEDRYPDDYIVVS